MRQNLKDARRNSQPTLIGHSTRKSIMPTVIQYSLDELDKELERRNHKFVRYVDDCNIFVHSPVAGERVLQSISYFIENKLKLVVNKDKSKPCDVNQTKFLG